METIETDVKKQQKKSKKNGASSNAVVATQEMDAPQEVRLDREDILSLTLIT